MGATGNPLFDNPALKAQVMASMQPPAQWQQASPVAGIAPPKPVAPPVQMPDQERQLPALPPPSQPQVIAPRGTLQGDQAEASRLRTTGSGISQIEPKIAGSEFGQHHPLLGKIAGYGLEGLAGLGDIALNATKLGRSIEPLIPGTMGHHQLLQARADNAVSQDTSEQEKQAQTAEAQARTGAIVNPPDEVTALPTDQGEFGMSRKTGKVTPLLGPTGEQLQPVEKPQAIQHAVLPDGSVVAISRDPKTGAVSADEVYKGDPKVQGHVIQREVDGKPHSVLVNSETGEDIRDLGETGEKPPVVRVETPGQQQGALDREVKQYDAPYGKMNDQAGAQLEKIDEARLMLNGKIAGQGLAAAKVLTALVSGQGSGVRITMPELQMFIHARGLAEDAQAFINRIAGVGIFPPEQQKQLSGLLDQVKARVVEKQQIANEAVTSMEDATDRQQILAAEKRARSILTGMEKYPFVRTDGSGNWYGSATADGKQAFDLATGKEVR